MKHDPEYLEIIPNYPPRDVHHASGEDPELAEGDCVLRPHAGCSPGDAVGATMRKEYGRFENGHEKIGGFGKGSIHTEHSKMKISDSLSDRLGEDSRRWLGERAGYAAKHMYLIKYFGKADHCDHCQTLNASRYEWANKNHGESRNKEDYIQLCPSCHRIFDQQDKCRKGHKYTPESTLVNCRGHRRCLLCKAETEAKNAAANQIPCVG